MNLPFKHHYSILFSIFGVHCLLQLQLPNQVFKYWLESVFQNIKHSLVISLSAKDVHYLGFMEGVGNV